MTALQQLLNTGNNTIFSFLFLVSNRKYRRCIRFLDLTAWPIGNVLPSTMDQLLRINQPIRSEVRYINHGLIPSAKFLRGILHVEQSVLDQLEVECRPAAYLFEFSSRCSLLLVYYSIQILFVGKFATQSIQIRNMGATRYTFQVVEIYDGWTEWMYSAWSTLMSD
jgi:hypothetical protein